MFLPKPAGRLSSAMPSGRRLTLLNGALIFLFASNVFDPGGALGLRYLAFAAVLLSTFLALKFFQLTRRELMLGFVLFVVWPLWSLFYGIVRAGDIFEAVVQVAPFIFVLILAVILPAVDQRLPLRMFYACLLCLSAAVIGAFALIALWPASSLSQTLFGFLVGLDQREGFFQTRSLGDLDVPVIYFRSTLFLVPAFVYYLFSNRLLRAAVILLGLGLALSKAGLTIALLFGAYYSVSFLFARPDSVGALGARGVLPQRVRGSLAALVLGGVATLIFFSLPTFSDQIRDAWAGNSETAEVRIGHFRSVMDLFAEHPSYLMIGQGVGVPFYSSGESAFVQDFEIDHLNTIRKFGLPWFIGFSAIVFYSAYRLIKSGDVELRAFGFALVGIYFAAGTNPVLISDLFIILMMLSYFASKRVLDSRVPKAIPLQTDGAA